MGGDLSTTKSSVFQGIRAAQVIRAAVLIAVGVAIAFSAPLHRDLSFDLWLLGGGLALIGAATLLEYLALRGTLESWWIAARSVVAFAAAGSLLAVNDTFTMALVLTLWASLTAVITVMRLVRGVQPTKVAVPSILLSVALAIASLVFRDDAVAVIGFFGAYAIIRGVFLGIAAFDPHPTVDAVPSSTRGSE